MKRLLASLCSLLLIIGVFAPNVKASTSLDNVTIMPGAVGIPDYVVADIVAANPGYHITINEWGSAPENPITVSPNIIAVIGFDVVSKKTTKTNVITNDKFIISVAKGQTISLGSKKTFKLECSVTGKGTKGSLGLTSSITREYSASSTWSGPPESSTYNSREFRIRFYRDQGTYTGYTTYNGVRIGSLESGTWTNPTRYAQYSKDYLID